jgi:hypothetical protein
VAGKIVEILTRVQVPTVKQNPSGPITDGRSELSGKLRLATSSVGYNGEESLA